MKVIKNHPKRATSNVLQPSLFSCALRNAGPNYTVMLQLLLNKLKNEMIHEETDPPSVKWQLKHSFLITWFENSVSIQGGGSTSNLQGLIAQSASSNLTTY